METLSYQKEIKATKEHNCNFCGYKIVPGEMYFKSTHKYEGEVYDWKTHKHCSEIADKLKMYDDVDSDSGVTEEHFQEVIHEEHDNLLIAIIDNDDVKKYSDIIQQLRKVSFRDKLSFVIRKYK